MPQERVYVAWPTSEFFSADEAPLDLTSRLLTDGLASRLNKALVYDKPLCTNVNSFNDTNEIAGEFIVIATARPGASLAEIERTIGEEIAKLAKAGPTAEELSRAQAKQEYDFVTGLEGIGGFGGKADLLNTYNTFLGDPGKLEADVLRHRRVTAGGRPARRCEVARQPQPSPRPFPSRSVGARRRGDTRPVEGARPRCPTSRFTRLR